MKTSALPVVVIRQMSPASQEGGLQIDERFRGLLGEHSLAALDAEPGSVIGLWPDQRIALLNSGWFRFARENGGSEVIARWPLGSRLLTGITGVLRDYYAQAFERVALRNEPWEQTYDCHSPTHGRNFQLQALPLARGAVLLIHSPVAEYPAGVDHAHPLARQHLERYVDADGVIQQCGNCRRTQLVDSLTSWDWVPELIASSTRNLNLGLCMTCVRRVYPDL